MDSKEIKIHEDEGYMVLFFDPNEKLDKLFETVQTVRETSKYPVIAIPKTYDLKYYSKAGLFKLQELYKTSVNIIEGVLYE